VNIRQQEFQEEQGITNLPIKFPHYKEYVEIFLNKNFFKKLKLNLIIVEGEPYSH
jgi:hypothetical protein